MRQFCAGSSGSVTSNSTPFPHVDQEREQEDHQNESCNPAEPNRPGTGLRRLNGSQVLPPGARGRHPNEWRPDRLAAAGAARTTAGSPAGSRPAPLILFQPSIVLGVLDLAATVTFVARHCTLLSVEGKRRRPARSLIIPRNFTNLCGGTTTRWSARGTPARRCAAAGRIDTLTIVSVRFAEQEY